MLPAPLSARLAHPAEYAGKANQQLYLEACDRALTIDQDPCVGSPVSSANEDELLSGREGTFRSTGKNAYMAENDLEALRAWITSIHQRRLSDATLDTYRREVERFMLWAVTERKTAMSSIGPTDLDAYEAFLAAPPARWQAKARVRHASIEWRPLRGPLRPSSIAVAMKVVCLLYRDWFDAGYLRANPIYGYEFKLIPQSKYWLTSKDWQVIDSQLRVHHNDVAARRTRAALLLMRRCHLRQQEVVALNFESLVRLQSPVAGFAISASDGALRPIDDETWTAIEAHYADRVRLIAETNLGRFENVPDAAVPLIGAIVVAGIREVGTAQPIYAHDFPSKLTYVGRIDERTLSRFVGKFFENTACGMGSQEADAFLARAKSWLLDPSRQTPERRRMILRDKALGNPCHEFVDEPQQERLELLQLFKSSSRIL